MAIFVQILALILLLGGIWLGNRQWIQPRSAILTMQSRGLLLLVVTTLVGSLIGSPFWWFDQPWSFAWDLPPLAGRMLASAGWSFFVLSLLALQRPTFRRMRLVLIALVVYLAPLVIMIALYHLDNFDPGAPITYGFFAIALPMTLAAIWYLLYQPSILPDEARDKVAATTVIQVWLGIVAGVAGVWGLALAITDNGPWSLIWAWPGDLLSSRLIAVMLVTIAAGSMYSARYTDPARVMLTAIVVYSLGLTVASLWNFVFGLPIKALYAAVFGVICLVSTVLLLTDKQLKRQLDTR